MTDLTTGGLEGEFASYYCSNDVDVELMLTFA